MIARNPDWFEFVQCILVTKYPAKCLKCLWHNYFILSFFFFIFWLIAVFKIRNNRPQCLMSSSWPFFCASEAWFGGQKCKPATKTIMLHSCDLENCEDTSATMAYLLLVTIVILVGHTSSAYNYLNQASSIIHSAKTSNVWRNIQFKNQSGYFPYRKINFRVGNQLTGSVIVGLFQTSSLSAISRVWYYFPCLILFPMSVFTI